MCYIDFTISRGLEIPTALSASGRMRRALSQVTAVEWRVTIIAIVSLLL